MLFLIVLFAFPFAFLTILKVLANISGWDRLSRIFPSRKAPPIREYSWQSVKCGIVDYKHCCIIGIGADELSIRIMKPFVFSHRPIAIPYGSLSAIGTNGLLFRTTVLRISGTKRRIEIADSMVDQVRSLNGIDLRKN